MSRSTLAAIVAIAAAYALLVWGTFAPGAMSPDSVSHWWQAVHGALDDWHPPILPLTVRLAMALGATTPAPLIAAQAFLLALGLQWLVLSLGASSPARGSPLARVLLVAPLLLLPPVLLYAQVFWKDVWMGIAFVWASVGFLALTHEPRRAGAWALFVGAGIFAACVRHNAVLLLAIPYLVLLLGAVGRRSWGGAVGISAAGVLTLAAPGLLATASGAERRHPEQVILVHDVAGVEQCTGFAEYSGLDAAEFLPAQHLRDGYTPRDVVPLFLGPDGGRRIDHVALWTQMPRLRHIWGTVVRARPACYLRHRTAVFREFMGVDRACYPFELNVMPNNGFGFAPTPLWPTLRERAVAWGEAVRDGLLFRTWPYVVLAVALALLARRRPVRWLLASGLLYLLAYFVVATTCDFRMGWVLVPLVVAAGVDALLRLSERLRPRGPPAGSGG